MTIYLDIIFLENLFMNYIILFASAVIMKEKIIIIRISISSIVGSIYAILSYMSILQIYSNIILKIILSIVMIYIAFNPKGVKSLIKQLMIFYLTSFTFGGVAFALLYFVNPQDVLFENGVLIGTEPIKIILVGGIVGFIIITSSFKNIKGRLSKKDILCDLKITINDKFIYVKAIIDTGNFLKEPITGTPVAVVEKQELYEAIPKEILDNLDKIINGEQIACGEYLSKIRIIPFSSLGKQNGILLGMKVDSIIINFEDINTYVENVIIGIYDGNLSKNGKYKALIGLEILEYEGRKNNELVTITKI